MIFTNNSDVSNDLVSDDLAYFDFLKKRKKTRRISVGNVFIGDYMPVAVQSMTNTDTRDIDSTVAQIKRLENVGCEIVRIAIVDDAAVASIPLIKSMISIPLIADIHFDYKLAIGSILAGVDGLRINPGNIGGNLHVKNVVDCAKDHGCSLRVGVNAGSLEKELIQKYQGSTVLAMVESAIRHVDLLTSMNFYNFKISIKASDVSRTVQAYRILSSKTDFPLHLGVTEAGTLCSGTVKSALGIGALLAEGIGDTIRVSLTADPVQEVRVAYEILKAVGIRRRGPEIISCPTCGRCSINLFEIAEQVEQKLMNSTLNIKIAIMGCVVNGPGEAKDADIGICGGDGTGILFKKGKVVKKFPQNMLVSVLLDEISKIKT